MATIHYFSVLRQKVQEEVAAERDRMASGQYKDWPTYREQVGYLNGLKAALDIVDEIEKGLT